MENEMDTVRTLKAAEEGQDVGAHMGMLLLRGCLYYAQGLQSLRARCSCVRGEKP